MEHYCEKSVANVNYDISSEERNMFETDVEPNGGSKYNGQRWWH